MNSDKLEIFELMAHDLQYIVVSNYAGFQTDDVHKIKSK